jgi:hypothetical protein
MTVDIIKTQLFCAFRSPVTIKRSENIVMSGVYGNHLRVSIPNKGNKKISISDGSATIRPYEMQTGTYEIDLFDDGEKIPLGTLSVNEDKATLTQISVSEAILRIVTTLDDVIRTVEETETRLDDMDEEFHHIPIANQSEV